MIIFRQAQSYADTVINKIIKRGCCGTLFFYKKLLLVLTRSKNSVIITKLFEGSGLKEKRRKNFSKKGEKST
jgi:hypothetical protein